MTYNMRVAILVSCGGHFLVQKALSDDYYVLVGGRVKYGEALFDAAMREAREELGFDVNHLELVGVNESIFPYENLQDIYQEHTFIFTAEINDTNNFSGDIEIVKMTRNELLESEVYPRNLEKILSNTNKFHHLIVDEVGVTASSNDLSFVIEAQPEENFYDVLNIRATGLIRKGEMVIVDTLGSFDRLIGGRMQQLESSLAGIKREVHEELGVSQAHYLFRGIAEDFFTHDWNGKQIRTHIVHFVYEVVLDHEAIVQTSEATVEYFANDSLDYERFKFKGVIPFICDSDVIFGSGILECCESE